MQTLTMASNELFRRTPDECFESLPAISTHCAAKRARSLDRWHPPAELRANAGENRLSFAVGQDLKLGMNDWSFSQLCRLASVSKDTVNRVAADTASRVFGETLPAKATSRCSSYTEGQMLRSIHGTSYTRVHDVDLVSILQEFAVDFQPPQKGHERRDRALLR